MNDRPRSFAEPVRVFSDLHLAHPASQVSEVEALRPLLEGVGTAIFNGDTSEQKCLGWKGRGEDLLGELKTLCSELDVAPIFVAGNHDPAISSTGWLNLGGGEIHVTHGHMVFPSVAPWSHEFLRKKREIKNILEECAVWDGDLARRWEITQRVNRALLPPPALKLGAKGKRYVFSALWPPERCFNIARTWATMVGEADRFLDRFQPEAKLMLFGHFHRPGVWRRGGRHLINTGAFMRGAYPLVVDIERPWVHVRRVLVDAKRCRLGASPAAFRLEGTSRKERSV